MSRSGYNDYSIDNWDLIRWRGQVASAIKGKRGQAFLRELIEALVAHQLVREIEYMNDEHWHYDPAACWRCMRNWAKDLIIKESA